MAVREILQLGNPGLRISCRKVTAFNTAALRSLARDLRDTLHDFKHRNGFGRGIAAPQIGKSLRVIFLHMDEPLVLVNPVIIARSRRTMLLWDDCFSFPQLMVRVKRALSVTIRYRDLHGGTHTIAASGGLSELLQHELDHLDGILAIDRAIDSKHIILRSEFEKWGHARIPSL